MAANLSRSAVVARQYYGTLARFREIQRSGHFRTLARLYAETHNQSVTNTVAATSKFSRMYARAHLKKDGTWKNPRHATSLRAKLLEAVGLRPQGATYAIGDTPTRK